MGDFTGPVVALFVDVDRTYGSGLQEQLETLLREAIRGGRLASGQRLPSSRGLATQLGVSRGTVSAAYGQLAAEGYVTSRQGAPVQVARSLRSTRDVPVAEPLEPKLPYDFNPALPDLAAFPRGRWLRALRRAWRESPLDTAGYGDPRGAPVLREQLAAYLGRVRGAAADPEQLIICNGFAQGFALLCRQLLRQGIERIAVEDPGMHAHRVIAEHSGLELAPVPVDGEGLAIDALRTGGAQAVLITPAHQFPTGVVLSRSRRSELIEWAEAEDALIIEDDYDTELRYDGPPVGALQGLAPEHVVLIGSASKRLVPGLRLAWMLTPAWLTWQLVTNKTIEDSGTETIGQLALADFIASGELDRHLRRMRSNYRARRATLLQALAEMLPQLRTAGSAAGLFEAVMLPESISEHGLITRAARRGVAVQGLEHHHYDHTGAPGLVLGYGNLAEPALRQGLKLLAHALAEGH